MKISHCLIIAGILAMLFVTGIQAARWAKAQADTKVTTLEGILKQFDKERE